MMNLKVYIKGFLNKDPFFRKLYYRYLSMTMLSEWYIQDAIKSLFKGKKDYPQGILDAGAGFGQFSYYLAKRFPNAQILALDIDEYRVEGINRFARSERLSLRAQRKDLIDLSVTEVFDLIICTDVIEHIEQDSLVLKNFFRALKPKGTLVISTPVSPQKRVIPFVKKLYHFTPEALHHAREGYSSEKLSDLIKKNNFAIQRVEFTYGFFGALAYEILFILQPNMTLFLFIFPFYILFFQPLVTMLMFADMLVKKKSGNGIVITALKAQ